ncbi:MAG: hypothetical protein HPY60_00325 [Candidatus Methanofastidiosum sp.]|nr:hypothetical protein [Methanofastidiosum sp.]
MSNPMKTDLKKKLESSDKEEILDFLATAELIMRKLSDEENNCDFIADYSGIIILYCKAIEKLESKKYKNNKIIDELEDFLNFTIENRDTKILLSEPDKESWISKMEEETVIGNKNAFYAPLVAKKLSKIFNEYKFQRRISDWGWDMFMYNTFLFLYTLKGNMDETKFNMFKKIFLLYHNDRNGAAHTESKGKNDAMRVRESVLGQDDIKESIIYNLIHKI